MTAEATFGRQSPARKWLVALMSRTTHGWIHDLHVRHGEPVMEPAPRVTSSVRFGRGSARRQVSADFSLKSAVCELFDRLDAMEDGVVRVLEVHDGLPFEMIVDVEVPAE